MKFRLTPLNIVISLLMIALVYQLMDGTKGYSQSIYFILMAFTCFIADLIFRSVLSDIKRIWIIELLFIIFAAAIFALINQ